MNYLFPFIIGTVLLAIPLFLYRARMVSRQRFRLTPGLPEELRDAVLFASEKEYVSYKPIPLRGRVDQVYQTVNGDLVIQDSKRRGLVRIYTSDRLQLSLYRDLIKNRPWSWLLNKKFTHHGYIRLITPSGVVYHRVDLLTTDSVQQTYQRYQEVMDGRVEPAPAAHRGLCRQCAYTVECPHMN